LGVKNSFGKDCFRFFRPTVFISQAEADRLTGRPRKIDGEIQEELAA